MKSPKPSFTELLAEADSCTAGPGRREGDDGDDGDVGDDGDDGGGEEAGCVTCVSASRGCGSESGTGGGNVSICGCESGTGGGNADDSISADGSVGWGGLYELRLSAPCGTPDGASSASSFSTSRISVVGVWLDGDVRLGVALTRSKGSSASALAEYRSPGRQV